MDEQGKTNDEIDGEDEEHEPPRRKRRNATTESIALLAVSPDNGGIVLACDGEGIEYEVRETSPHLGDLGLDDAPEGISIWEGRVVYSGRGYFGDDDPDVDMKGAFRRPTSEEWARIAAGLTPWEFEDEATAAPTKTEPSADERRRLRVENEFLSEQASKGAVLSAMLASLWLPSDPKALAGAIERERASRASDFGSVEIANAIDMSRRALFSPGREPTDAEETGRSLQKQGVSSRHVAEALRLGVLVFAGTSDDE